MNGKKWSKNEREEDAAHVVKRARVEGKLTFDLPNRKHYLRLGGKKFYFLSIEIQSFLRGAQRTRILIFQALFNEISYNFSLRLDVLVRSE